MAALDTTEARCPRAEGRIPAGSAVLFGGREAILSRDAVNQTLPHFKSLSPDQGRVAIYRRGYHLLLRDYIQYTVFDDIAAWIRDPQAPLPSGADAAAAQPTIDAVN